jgi:enterochelin esterase-like enzyme
MIIGSQEANFHDCGFVAGFFHISHHFQTDDPPLSGRRIDVFLPRDYGQSRKRYPVLYMNDGGTAFVPGGLVNESWNMADTIEKLYEMGKISPLIVVAIYPINRAWEYTHAAWNSQDASGGLDRYTHCVADCIKPFIDRFSRTLPDPKSTMILGSSHGGLAAFYIANCRPTAFGFAAALSPSFWVGLDDGSFFPWVKPSLDARLGLRSLSSLNVLNTHCRTVPSGQGSISAGGLFGLAGLATRLSKNAPLPDAEKWLHCCSIATGTKWVMSS